MTENAERATAHPVAIAKPTEPGGPYIITCACGFVAEAHYPTAALVGAYDHKGTLYNGGQSFMSLAASIPEQRAYWAQSLRQLADKLDDSTDNHLASILGFEIGAITRGLAEMYAAVEAQRSVAFAKARHNDSNSEQ